MVRKLMQRNVTSTKVEFSEVVVQDGAPTIVACEPVVLTGKLSEEKALSAIKRKNPDKNVVVTNVSHETALYTMPVDKFIELSDKSTQA
ncbi:hypothetical protein [Enterococcus faecium]|uniref:histone-like protein p6 n=1 Tax=Enterococcus faecium TaxID=1352 RepID=UPI0007640FD9|nr:hypothetical protein [Enterococcus faecium]KWY14144.1 hypothetical protein AS229_11100 [Enterococcus faecium]KWY32259.1 hypothetical protein AS234_11915 [Enterococcus faecium]KWY41517.1 hypothetical protein AS236_13200 [Enterococcus faecium]KWY58123.1 hypothetical protein AS242_14310 [Enterococcus faecium]KWY77220.1 hypothetical protein AS251_13920 [Enterococcus faecium]